MTDEAIRCEGLSRRYGSVQALRPLDLTVPSGSVFGCLVRNGAGKTATIRLLTGLAHPTTGRAWVNGRETTNGDGLAAEQFGYLPQEPAFYNWMTPVEYLNYVGRLFRLETAVRKQRIPELLALVGLEKAAKRRIGGFSGGMKQRLGLAQALIHQPPILRAAEPTGNLYSRTSLDIMGLFQRLRSAGNTIILVTHEADIAGFANRVVHLLDGRIERDERN